MNLDLEQLGAFSFISFLKRSFTNIDRRNFNFLTAATLDGSIKDMQVLEKHDAELFNEMTDTERKAHIISQATDLHESHHFHSLLLIPAGEILLRLILTRLVDTTKMFFELGERLRDGKEPFGESLIMSANQAIDGWLAYYLDGTFLAEIALEERVGKYSAAYSVKYNTGPKGSFAPGLKIEDRIYPVGLRVILEGWTESLIRALIFRSRPREYYEWYISTRVGDDLWVYTLLDRILTDIFGSTYTSLDPMRQHTLIAHICIEACNVNYPNRPDFMEYRDNHPGWNLLTIFELIWSERDFFIKNNIVDVNHVCRVIRRSRLAIAKLSRESLLDDYKDNKSFLDHYVNQLEIFTRSPTNEPDLIEGFWHEYGYYHIRVMGIYLQHPDVFYNAAEWLNCKTRDLLPRVPIMIAMTPESTHPKLNFPDERRADFWFSWFIFSQLLESIARGKAACPIVLHNVDVVCQRSESCESLVMGDKDGLCYLHQLLSLKPK